MLANILAAHANHLTNGEGKENEYLTLFPELREELAPLLALVRRSKELLAPVTPSQAFRRRLRRELLNDAQQRQIAPLAVVQPRWRQPWVIVAATLGSVISLASAVGVIVYRRRVRADKPAVAAG